jgi:threonine synthase
MKYYNIKNRSEKVSFRDAVCRGISSDMGLYMPAEFPRMDSDFFRRLPSLSLPGIAFEVGSAYTGDEIPATELRRICDWAFDFPLELVQTADRKYSLELFHGPTAAFKDFGARFMSQCFRYFADEKHRTVVLVATSGDTGGAIANSFLGIDGVDVIILYPSGKVSEIQEKQLTTLGRNISALEVEGTFDDCQAMVKTAFTQYNTHNRINLTSANSINISRLIPQSFYYYWAVSRLSGKVPVISVPSGNFGNITGAMFAWATGLPVECFIASTNINRVVPEYLETGKYNPRVSVQTIANAMDVGNPSNFDRMMTIFENDWNKVIQMVTGYWFTDDEIRKHIASEYKQCGYLLDPHGAVGSMGLDLYLEENPSSVGIFVETAHPAKFIDVVEPVTGVRPELPESLKSVLPHKKEALLIKPEYRYLEEYLNSAY